MVRTILKSKNKLVHQVSVLSRKKFLEKYSVGLWGFLPSPSDNDQLTDCQTAAHESTPVSPQKILNEKKVCASFSPMFSSHTIEENISTQFTFSRPIHHLRMYQRVYY